MLYGKKGFVDDVYIVKVESLPKYRYFFTSAREAEKSYREQFNLKYKRITWIKAYY